MAVAAPDAGRARSKVRTPLQRWLIQDLPRFTLLAILAIIFLAPLYWMVSTSLKLEYLISGVVQWIPNPFTLDNYREVLGSADAKFGRWVWNSVFTATAFTIVHLTLCVLAAYPLARMRFKGRDVWFWFILSSMMVPGFVTLVPTYQMMLNFSWIDSYHALIWPGAAGAFGVFMLRQFFIALPYELEEAARIDGANTFQILWKVVLPLSVPALVTLGVFAFMGSWNNYVWPLYVIQDPDMQTLPVGIASYSQRYQVEYGKQLAGTALAAIPVLIAYLLAQRFLVQGIAFTGMKD
ncbi:MAG TPA: carbohydrate ABC transporter permease [Deinococcales bacterium]|nr:carbohydrate ABC transporter permease [Deinococcales bacterium]